MIVVDASVAVKWFFSEPGTADAAAVLADHEGAMIAPELFVVETAGTLVRGANADKTMRSAVDVMLDRLMAMWRERVVVVQAISPELYRQAAKLALDLGHPFKDCIYLALAIERDCPLVTADARFVAKARAAWDRMRLIGGTAR